METTAKIVEKLTFWRSKIRNARKRLMHVVLSPDPEMISDFLNSASKRRGVTLTDLIQVLRDEALSYLSAKSNRKPAGVLILHPCRPNELYYDERGGESREEEERPEKGLKKWVWILRKHNWYDYAKFSPTSTLLAT